MDGSFHRIVSIHMLIRLLAQLRYKTFPTTLLALPACRLTKFS